MFKLPLARLSVARSGALLSIVRWLPILIAPIAVLWTYGKIQAVHRERAEHRVEQLTVENARLDKALERMKTFELERVARTATHAKDLASIANEDSDVLSLPAPDIVVNVLRP